jgi:putative spermidine/putrescine transport system permease protein
MTTFFLSPLIVPGVVMGFALLIFFSSIYELSGLVRLIAGHTLLIVPYTIRTTLAGLVGIGKNLTEAAQSLGATEQQAFWDITFPLARTGIVAGAVFAFAFSMDDVAASIFLTDSTNVTLPVAMVSMMRTSYDPTIAAASALLVLFTILIVLLLDWVVGLNRIVGQGIYRT